jgi:hypothetical protein
MNMQDKIAKSQARHDELAKAVERARGLLDRRLPDSAKVAMFDRIKELFDPWIKLLLDESPATTGWSDSSRLQALRDGLFRIMAGGNDSLEWVDILRRQ